MVYLTFIGGNSNSYYYQEFENVREAEIFRQCFQAYVRCGYGHYINMRICKRLPVAVYTPFYLRNRKNVYKQCSNIIVKSGGYL